MFKDKSDKALLDLLRDKFDNHIVDAQLSDKYVELSKRIKTYHLKLREHPEEIDLKFISGLDDCFVDMMIMFEEYLYIQGYKDGRNSKGIFSRLIEWIKTMID